jgi:hypothetical protein
MKFATQCQFCQKPITLIFDDEYIEMIQDVETIQLRVDGKDITLIDLAACNHCADVRVDRRNIEDRIEGVCVNFARSKQTPERRNATKNALTALTKAYAAMIARWHCKQGMAWDAECVELLLDKPEHFPKIISVLWDLFKDSQKTTTSAATVQKTNDYELA